MTTTIETELLDLGPFEDVSLDAWAWPNFRPFELRHRFDGRVYIVKSFLDKIQELRNRVGFGLEVNSYYRSPDYDTAIGGAGTHPTGRAIDFRVAGTKAWHLQHKAAEMGFTGIGINQKGPWDKRFIHLDDLTTGNRPRIWSY